MPSLELSQSLGQPLGERLAAGVAVRAAGTTGMGDRDRERAVVCSLPLRGVWQSKLLEAMFTGAAADGLSQLLSAVAGPALSGGLTTRFFAAKMRAASMVRLATLGSETDERSRSVTHCTHTPLKCSRRP